MFVEVSLSKKEMARYRQHAARMGVSLEQLIADAVRNLRASDPSKTKR